MKTSLATQFSLLTVTIIITFSLLIAALLIYQNRMTGDIEQKNDKLEEKEKIATDLRYSFNLAISEMRAYYAFDGDKSYFEKVEEQKEIVEEKIAALQDVAENEEDVLMIQDTQDFYNYYFHDVMPKTKEYYDSGQFDEVTQIAVTQNASETIRTYQRSMKDYTNSLHDQLKTLQDQFPKKVFISQVVFVFSLFLLIVSMVIFTRIMLSKIRRPLNELTGAASEIADGQTVVFTDKTNRKDELGLLSKAFEKMSKSIQEKEQDLHAQNEELLAQQDELQAQQNELVEALEMMKKSELILNRRNELIRGIANSLDKKKVLSSIVETMCEVICADKGMIVLLNHGNEHASFGVSEQGVEQVINHLHSGLIVRLMETKQPYTVKRESLDAEKAYHTSISYSFDLYLPVLAGSGNIEAIMMFTRFGQSFNDDEIVEYDSLSKQIAISLDKIKLFEQSETERLLTQDILNTINEGIQLVDVDGTVIQANEKLCDMISCHFSTILNKRYEDWSEQLTQSVENKFELKRFFDRILFEEKFDERICIYHQHYPSQRVVQVYCEPLTRNGEKFGTVIVHRDITKEYEVDVMKSEFVSTVSHELRTPLASVLGFTELMLNKELKPDRQKKYLTTIYQEAKRLTVLINDFLDVQRMEAGKQTYDKKYDDIIPLLRNIIETHEINHPHHVIHFEARTKNTMVLGDKDKIAQVFTNLINNAIKYSPDGGDIFVMAYEEGSNLKVEVRDEGLGIPAEAIEKLYTKFYRVDNSDNRKIGGTGLGLAIVKEIMKAHGGEIFVQSELKKGSIFTVSFPLVIGISEQIKDEDSNSNKKDKVNVIIVEDDISLANLLQTELEESNFHVKVFSEGDTALTAIKTERPDAIVLDIMLEEKGLNGWDIIKHLKGIEAYKSIPIFISTALDDKEKGLALGANDYLIKPYQPSKLSKLILQTLLKKDWSGQILVPSENNE
jgi:signal transduction histidine kinase/ActR/RegA family two-component response regulator